MREREVCAVLGYDIGTATGWDQQGYWDIVLYEFEPFEGFDMPAGDLCVSYESGNFSIYDDNGNETENKDILIVMNGFVSRQKMLKKKAAVA